MIHSFVNNINRMFRCNSYILTRRKSILMRNILSNSKPFSAEMTYDLIHNKEPDLCQHYGNFILQHIEFYVLTVIFTYIVDYIYQLYKCSNSDVCEIDE
jgi:hypothetical protein